MRYIYNWHSILFVNMGIGIAFVCLLVFYWCYYNNPKIRNYHPIHD